MSVPSVPIPRFLLVGIIAAGHAAIGYLTPLKTSASAWHCDAMTGQLGSAALAGRFRFAFRAFWR